MSVHVGIDVHRKRSWWRSSIRTARCSPTATCPRGPILRLIGGQPAGTKAVSGAAFSWGWLVDYGSVAHLVHPLQCKAITSAQLKNDKGRRGDPGAAATCGPAAGGAGSPRPG
jgi:transposase